MCGCVAMHGRLRYMLAQPARSVGRDPRRAWIQANRLIRKRGLGPAFDSC
eukprot:COSAG01_NODE_2071_length_8496_cov_5.773252_5_plen_50_part_00